MMLDKNISVNMDLIEKVHIDQADKKKVIFTYAVSQKVFTLTCSDEDKAKEVLAQCNNVFDARSMAAFNISDSLKAIVQIGHMLRMFGGKGGINIG